MWGGGGGGGRVWSGAYCVGQGGASGAYNMGVFSVSGGQYTITVGTGGSYTDNGAGQNGNQSSVTGPGIPTGIPFYAGGGTGGSKNGAGGGTGCYAYYNVDGGSYSGGDFGINGTPNRGKPGDRNEEQSFALGVGAPLGGGGSGIVPGSGGDYYQNGANGRVIIWAYGGTDSGSGLTVITTNCTWSKVISGSQLWPCSGDGSSCCTPPPCDTSQGWTDMGTNLQIDSVVCPGPVGGCLWGNGDPSYPYHPVATGRVVRTCVKK